MNCNLSDLTGLSFYQQDNYTQPGSWHPKILADIPILQGPAPHGAVDRQAPHGATQAVDGRVLHFRIS